jgi:hypothetical protein
MKFSIEDFDAGGTSPDAQRLDDVAFAGARISSKHDVLMGADKIKVSELQYQGLVDGLLEFEIKGFQGGPIRHPGINEPMLNESRAFVFGVWGQRPLY